MDSEMIKEWRQVMSEIDKMSKKYADRNKKHITDAMKQEGMRISTQASRQPEDVFISPFMKHIIQEGGDLKKEERLKVHDPVTKGEQAVINFMKEMLLKHNGPERKEYNTKLNVDDPDHYNVDCWRQAKLGVEDNIPTIREIQPGQEDQRYEAFERFLHPTEAIKDILAIKEATIAADIIKDSMPKVEAAKEFKAVSLPFQNKNSNVSYPYWRNDRLIDPSSGTTYGKLCIAEAEKQTHESIWDYHNFTLYGKNVRGKGRPVLGSSRVEAVWLNRLESQEIEAYKWACPMFVGYNNPSILKRALINVATICNMHNLECENRDFKQFDTTVPPQLLSLWGAISTDRAKGAESKRIALTRAAMSLKATSISKRGINDIYGRIFSGFIDTNRVGGCISGHVVTTAQMIQDKDYTSLILPQRTQRYWLMVMGDDNLTIKRRNIPDRITEIVKENFNMDVYSAGHEKGGEFGTFFLQWRLFRDKTAADGYSMAYPWPRVLRSILYDPEHKGLGPYGWCIAIWQQLLSLVSVPKICADIIRYLSKYDDLKLALDVSVSTIFRELAQEDKDRLLSEGVRASTTEEKLFDGDPAKRRVVLTPGRNPTLVMSDGDVGLASQQKILRNIRDKF